MRMSQHAEHVNPMPCAFDCRTKHSIASAWHSDDCALREAWIAKDLDTTKLAYMRSQDALHCGHRDFLEKSNAGISP